MLSFFLAHWASTSLAAAAIAAFVAIGLIGGWALVLNRYGIGALAAILGLVAGQVWLSARDSHMRDEGARALAVAVQKANDAAEARRKADITAYVTASAARETELRARLATAEGRIDAARDQRKGVTHVTKKADAACVIPRGFVRQHNTSLPPAAGRADVPIADADIDKPAGVALSEVVNVVDWNYSECAKLEERYNATEERRFQSCLAWDAKFGVVSGCSR